MSSTVSPMQAAENLMETTANSAVVHFHWIDYIVLVVMLVLSLAVGMYFALYSGKQKTTAEYFRGDSKMPLIPVVLSIMASYCSSNGMLGIPAEVYLFGFNYWFVNLGSLIGIPLAVYCLLPVFYDLKMTSVYEYLERRFDKRIRRCGSLLCIFTMMIYASFVTYGPALALSQVTGFSLWGSILTTTIIGSIYTSLGGIKAVIWTDSAQFIIFSVALLVAVIKGVIDIGGFSVIIDKAYEGGRLGPLSFSLDPRVRFTFWGCFIASSLRWTNGYGLSQIQIQRYQSCPTKEKAQKGLWLNYPGMIIVSTIYCFLGLIIYAQYHDCDPKSSGQIHQADQIFPLYVMQIMKSLPGLPGLFVAGVYSASLSTISSELNSLAAITLEDFVKPWYKNLSDEKATTISKFIALGYGALCLLIIAGITNLGSIVQAISYIVGCSDGCLFGIFTLGLTIPWSNVKGTIAGLICGLSLSSWLAMGNQILKPRVGTLHISTDGCNSTIGSWIPPMSLPRSEDIPEVYKISYLWIFPLAWLVTVFVGATTSYFFDKKTDVEPSLLSPPIRYLMQKLKKNKFQFKSKSFQDEDLTFKYQEPAKIPMMSAELLDQREENGGVHTPDGIKVADKPIIDISKNS